MTPAMEWVVSIVITLALIVPPALWMVRRFERELGGKRHRDPVIGVDQFTEQRRLQHANVGHKAAKGFHSVKHDDDFSRGSKFVSLLHPTGVTESRP